MVRLWRLLLWRLKKRYIVKPQYAPIAGTFSTVPSPNYNIPKHLPRKVELVVLHATESSGPNGLKSTIQWFKNKGSCVSAHYVVDKDGTVVQMVSLNYIAWHAGVSKWGDNNDVNRLSVGMECINSNTGQDPYPVSQINSVMALCLSLCRLYGLNSSCVVGHKDVARGRKTDPAGFPFERFKTELDFYLTAPL